MGIIEMFNVDDDGATDNDQNVENENGNNPKAIMTFDDVEEFQQNGGDLPPEEYEAIMTVILKPKADLPQTIESRCEDKKNDQIANLKRKMDKWKKHTSLRKQLDEWKQIDEWTQQMAE